MGFIDFVRESLSQDQADNPRRYIDVVEENNFLQGQIASAEMRLEELEESLLEIADAFDNIGWSLGLDELETQEMPLKTVKKMSSVARAMETMNPFIHSAVSARIAYVWGNGVQFEDASKELETSIRKNRHTLFSQQAYAERERAAATDGNVFLALKRETTDVLRIPLAQITGSISNPDNTEEIWFYKREWKTSTKNFDKDVTTEEEHKLLYPSLRHAQELEDSGGKMPKRMGNVGVSQTYVMQHDAVNKQVGWRWGVPDILPVMFWARAYKEYLEDNLDLVKAYSRIAWQIKASSQAAANSASAQWASRPTRDPITGEISTTGAAAVTGLSTELVPTAVNSSAIDFTTGNPVAAAIAAGLGVSLSAVLPTPENTEGGATLSLAVSRSMKARQELWTNSFLDIFEFWGDDSVKVTWGAIEEDETHRRVQSVQLAAESAVPTLHPDEARAEILKTLRIVPLHTEVPEPPQQDVPAAVPGQGVSGAVGSVNSGRGQVKQAVKKALVNK